MERPKRLQMIHRADSRFRIRRQTNGIYRQWTWPFVQCPARPNHKLEQSVSITFTKGCEQLGGLYLGIWWPWSHLGSWSGNSLIDRISMGTLESPQSYFLTYLCHKDSHTTPVQKYTKYLWTDELKIYIGFKQVPVRLDLTNGPVLTRPVKLHKSANKARILTHIKLIAAGIAGRISELPLVAMYTIFHSSLYGE